MMAESTDAAKVVEMSLALVDAGFKVSVDSVAEPLEVTEPTMMLPQPDLYKVARGLGQFTISRLADVSGQTVIQVRNVLSVWRRLNKVEEVRSIRVSGQVGRAVKVWRCTA
jgi:hypothetical protein